MVKNFGLQESCLEYCNIPDWKNFVKVINRAMLSCKNSGYEILDHFSEVGKMVDTFSNVLLLAKRLA